MKSLVFALLLMGVVGTASAGQGDQITDGHSLKRCLDLMEKANNGDELAVKDQVLVGYGLGFFKGFSDANALTLSIGVQFPFKVPGNVSFIQSALAVKKYVDSHPEILNLQAALVVALALKEEYPNPDYKPPAKP